MNLFRSVIDICDTLPTLATLVGYTAFADVVYTFHRDGFLLDLLDGIGTVKCLVDFFERSPTRLDEEEVDGDELDDQPALEEEVELPAAGSDTDGNDILRDEQADISADALQKQTICTNLEAKNLQRVSNVE